MIDSDRISYDKNPAENPNFSTFGQTNCKFTKENRLNYSENTYQRPVYQQLISYIKSTILTGEIENPRLKIRKSIRITIYYSAIPTNLPSELIKVSLYKVNIAQ